MRPRKRYKVGYNEQIKDNAKSAYLIKESLNKGTLKPPSDAMVDPSGNPYVFALPAAIVGEEYTRDEQGRITFSSPLQRSNYFYNRNLGEEGISEAREMEASVREGTTNAVQGALQAYAAFSEPLSYLQKALVTAPLAQAMGKLDEVNLNPVAMLSGQDPGISSPSEALGIENPIGAFAVDALTDPLNFAGAGLLSAIRKQRMKGADIPFDLPEGVGGGGPARNLPSGGGGNQQKKPNRYVPAPLGDNAFVPKSLMDQGILAKQANPEGILRASEFERTMNSDNLSSGDKTYIRKALELMPEIANEKGDVNLNNLRIMVHSLYNPKVTSTSELSDYNIYGLRGPERGPNNYENREAFNIQEADQVLVELEKSGFNIDENIYDNVVYEFSKWANDQLATQPELTGDRLKPLSDYVDPVSLVEKSIEDMRGSIFSKPLKNNSGVKLPDNLQTTLGPFIRYEYGEYVPNVSARNLDANESEIFPMLDFVASKEEKEVIINEFAKSANDMQYITESIEESDPEGLSKAVSGLDDHLFYPEFDEELTELITENHPILSITDNLSFDEDVMITASKVLRKYDNDSNPETRDIFKQLFDDPEIDYKSRSNAMLRASDDDFQYFLQTLGGEFPDSETTKLFNAKNNAEATSRGRLRTALESLSEYNYYIKSINSRKEDILHTVGLLNSNPILSVDVKKEIISFVSMLSDNFFDENNLLTIDDGSEQIRYYQNPLLFSGKPQRHVRNVAEYLTPRNGRSLNNDIDIHSFIDYLSDLGLQIPEKDPVRYLEILPFIAEIVKRFAFSLDGIEAAFEQAIMHSNELFLASSGNSFSNIEVEGTNLSKSLDRLDQISGTAKAIKNLKQRKFSQRNKALQSLVERGKDPSKVNVGRTTFLISANSLLKDAGFRGPRQAGNPKEHTHWDKTQSPEAWGHIRVHVDLEYPEILQVHESQSDLLQTSKKEAEQGLRRSKSEFNELEAPFLRSLKEVDTYQRTLLYKAIQIAINNGQTQIAFPTKETATIIQGYPTKERWQNETDFSERARKASTPIDYPKKNEDGTTSMDEEKSSALEKIREDYEKQARFAAKELNVPMRKEVLRGYPYYVFDIPEKFLKKEAEMPTFEKGGKFTINKIKPKKFLRAMKKK